MQPRLSWRKFCQVVEEVMAALPPQLSPYLENLVVDVEAAPPRHWLKELEVRHDTSLMGIFEGRGIDELEFGEKSFNRIVLFKQPIEAACRNTAEIRYEIRRTVLHELAHHFGFSEEALDFFEQQPSPFDDPEDR